MEHVIGYLRIKPNWIDNKEISDAIYTEYSIVPLFLPKTVIWCETIGPHRGI